MFFPRYFAVTIMIDVGPAPEHRLALCAGAVACCGAATAAPATPAAPAQSSAVASTAPVRADHDSDTPVSFIGHPRRGDPRTPAAARSRFPRIGDGGVRHSRPEFGGWRR